MTLYNSKGVINALLHGAVGVIATDTVYGIVASAKSQQATERLYTLKNRQRKPGTLIAASLEQLLQLGAEPAHLKRLTDFWPGPLSAVLPIGDDFAYLEQGVGDIAMRVTADTALRELLLQTGPLISSSANTPGKPPATTIHMAYDYFGDSVDFYMDGGERANTKPSTIIRFMDNKIEVLREGEITIPKALQTHSGALAE